MNERQIRPTIGDRVAFRGGIGGEFGIGTITAIAPEESRCWLAVPGYRCTIPIALETVGERDHEGVWRGAVPPAVWRLSPSMCGHVRGYNAAGLCFDCGHFAGDAQEDASRGEG